jgi:hypothetical protein
MASVKDTVKDSPLIGGDRAPGVRLAFSAAATFWRSNVASSFLL